MIHTWRGQTKEEWLKEYHRDKALTPEERKKEWDEEIEKADQQYHEYKKKYDTDPKENNDEWTYIHAEKPNSLDNGEATVSWIIVMLVGTIFKERLFIWIIATIIYLCWMNRYNIRKLKWDNGGKQEYYNKINDACNVKEKKNEPHKKYLKYIIVYDWSYDDESGTRIIEKDTLEAIKKEFEKITVIERQFAQDRKLEIFEDNPIYFEAGNPNNYREEHIKVEIKKLLQD